MVGPPLVCETALGSETIDCPRSSVVDWLIWQFADSAFPTGGFVHSGGLEAAWQHGEIRGRADLQAFIQASLNQLGSSVLPFVSEVHRQPGKIEELDRLFDAFTTNHIANRASRLQGLSLAPAAERIFAHPGFKPLHQPALPFSHVALVFGFISQVVGLELVRASRLFLFQQLRTLTNAAVRLGIVGPMEGQTLQYRLAPLAELIVSRSLTQSLADLSQSMPLLDLWQGTQGRLYSRLFQS